MIGAAVDVGSNSIHLLVAEITRDGLRYLRDESVLLGLGDVVDQLGELPAGSQQQVLDALAVHRQAAQSEGAQMVTFIGTEPLRRAINAEELTTQLHETLGIALHVLSERAEAELTYLGVTGGVPLSEPLLVIDIGGGSTELIIATPGEGLRIHSLPTGSARLSVGILLNDPPRPNEYDRLRAGASRLIRALLPPVDASRAVFVGGTATNLVKLAPLTRAGLEAAHGLVTSLSVTQLVERYVVNSRRARQLPAGAAIVAALLDHFGLESAEVSQASLRDGAILASVALGADWPARLTPFVLGSPR
jgi:exopolyphosphatase / guanosine-5'-triphosphate,3'-diphosphate pyrophosphatase